MIVFFFIGSSTDSQEKIRDELNVNSPTPEDNICDPESVFYLGFLVWGRRCEVC